MSDTAFSARTSYPGARRSDTWRSMGRGGRTSSTYPYVGSGDGGIYTTAADVAMFWRALFAGSIVRKETLAEMLRERSAPGADRGYGLGFWLPAGGRAVRLHGGDTGVAFVTVHDQERLLTWTLLSNTGEGTGAIAGRLEQERTAGSSSLPR